MRTFAPSGLIATLGPLLFGTLALVGCAQRSGAQAAQPIGTSNEVVLNEVPDDAAPPEREVPDENIVRQAGRPFEGYRVADKKRLSPDEFFTYMASADAICIGESHGQALDHYAQLRTIEALLERRSMRGFELGVALEMVRQDSQNFLTAFEQSRISSDDFADLSNWDIEWGVPIQYYLPQLRSAAESGARLLALGVERALTHEIATGGIEALDPKKIEHLPELDFDSAEHRELFDDLMQEHPHGSQEVTAASAPKANKPLSTRESDLHHSPEHHEQTKANLEFYYEAQVVWDESMAKKSADFLLARRPGRKLIILAGKAHCHRDAIPKRLMRRTGMNVVSLLPVTGGKVLSYQGSNSHGDDRLADGYDFQLVYQR